MCIRDRGYETIIVNNNPETVSTDFDIADKLYFEPLTQEDVESIVDIEKPDGAVVQFGGQTAIKLTESLMKMGVPILGTAAENVDAAEDRELFDDCLLYTSIMLSNGPGDPKENVEIIKEIRKLYESDVPIFAICLGHQLMALATGADTFKLK